MRVRFMCSAVNLRKQGALLSVLLGVAAGATEDEGVRAASAPLRREGSPAAQQYDVTRVPHPTQPTSPGAHS